MNPREAAALSLNSAFKNGRFVNLELDSTIKKYGFADKDKSFYTRLLYGTVEKKLTLDWYLSKIYKTALSDIEPLVRCILETALYQIFEMDRVPDSAACNEATELVKKLCPGSYAGFVNAILRNTIRKKASLRAELQALTGLSGVSVRHSIPLWICRKWESDYGQGFAEQIAHGFECIPPHLTLHINTLKTTADDYLAKLDASLCPRKIGETLITLSGSAPVESLPGFDEGLFFIQDESSALCAALVSAAVAGISAPTVIDTCACPGGKTFAIAIANADRGTLYSFDLHANRLPLIERGTKRLGIASVKTEARDARQPDAALFGRADAVLCDVPCSGLGILAKKPDIRYKKEEEIARLPEIGLDILCKSAAYVKPGGALIYSTCTLCKAENEENVAAFLERNPDFAPAKLAFRGAVNGTKTFFPQTDGTDGFFVAKFIRNKE